MVQEMLVNNTVESLTKILRDDDYNSSTHLREIQGCGIIRCFFRYHVSVNIRENVFFSKRKKNNTILQKTVRLLKGREMR